MALDLHLGQADTPAASIVQHVEYGGHGLQRRQGKVL